MKKTLSILLLLCMSLNIAGLFLVFHFRRIEVKAEMKSFLKNNPGTKHLTEFKFSLQDKATIEKIKWEGDDEFFLDDEMFDIIEKKIVNGQLVIKCINDKEETALIKDFEKISKEQQGDPLSKSRSGSLLKLISNVFIIKSQPYFQINDSKTILLSDSGNIRTSSAFIEVLTPPPQAILPHFSFKDRFLQIRSVSILF